MKEIELESGSYPVISSTEIVVESMSVCSEPLHVRLKLRQGRRRWAVNFKVSSHDHGTMDRFVRALNESFLEMEKSRRSKSKKSRFD